MNRLEFFKSTLMAGTAAIVTPRLVADGAAEGVSADALAPVAPAGQLLGSEPVLLNPAERTIDVVFAVNGEASGWVEMSQRLHAEAFR